MWVDDYGDYLYRYAISRVRNEATAEDLVQETFLSALKALSSFEERSSIRTWLTSILKNKIIDYFRKSPREVAIEEDNSIEDFADRFFDKGEHWIDGPQRWRENPEKAMEQKQFWDVFYQCLDYLPQKLHQAFVLREMEGLETEEICKVLDSTASNFWVMMYRARMSIRKCLEKLWFRVKK